MQHLGQIIAMGNCHVLKRERERERERENKRSKQKLGLTCTEKQVSSKFITSLLLAILEGWQRRKKVCVDCFFSNMNASLI